MALFFSPPWQAKKPQKRIQSLDKLPPQQANQILSNLALKDPDNSVRQAALARINSADLLLKLLPQANSDVATPIRQKLISLLDGTEQLPLESRQRWLRNCRDQATLEHLGCYATEAELRRTALQQADQQKLWQHCLQHDPSPNNRRFAVSRIHSTQALKQLIEQLRTKDKNTTQLLQQTLEQRLFDEGDSDTIAALLLRCCQQLESLIEQNAAETALTAVDNDWQRIYSHPAAAQHSSLADRYARGRRVFLRLHQPAEPPQEKPQAEPSAEPDTADHSNADAQKIAQQLKQWLQTKQTPRDKKLQTLRQQWQTLKPSMSDTELANTINQQFSQLKQRLHEQQQQWQQSFDAAVAQIPNIQPLLDNGQLQAARELHQQLEKQLQQLKTIQSAKPLHDAFSQLNQVNANIRELGGWQHWSNNRKRRELCDRVEALIGKDIEPEALAEEIKKQQAEWKALDAAETNKGSASPALWRRFQQLCHTAWEPCSEHFEAKKQARAQKRQQIEQIMQDLLAFGDKAKTFDEKVVGTTVRSGYRMLSELQRMPHKERRSLEKQLRQALAPFEKANQNQQKQAAYAKRQLIEKASLLNPDDDLGLAIKQMKQLQADWKQSGRCAPKVDRELWAEFRQQADRIFGVADQQRSAQNQARKTANQQLAGLINDIASLANDVTSHTAQELHKLVDEADELESQGNNRQLSQQLADAKTSVKVAIQRHSQNQRLANITALAQQAETRLADAANATDNKTATSAHDAVIKMEILAGKASPKADADRRLALQVEQLSANLAGGGNANSLLDLVEHWYQQAQVSAADWPALHQRVQALLK